MTRRLAACFLVAAVASVASCRHAEAPAAAPPAGETWLTDAQIRGALLKIRPAEKRNLTRHLVTAGRVGFDEARVAHVFSSVGGRVTSVLGGFGQRVRRGEALAAIESPELGAARSDVIKARADLVALELEARRQRDLYEHHASAERDAEAAEASAAKARAELERARRRLEMLHVPDDESANQEFVLRSPIAGEVITRTATPGLEVQGMLSGANVVQELFTIGDIERVWIWGDLYERDLGGVHRGQNVTISTASDPEHPVAGTVDYLSDALDKDTHTARLRCEVDNAGSRLKPEMYVTLSIELDAREALAVPREAVLKTGDRTEVVVEDGRAPDGRTRFLWRPVEVGDADDGWVSVVSGLSAGERVVVSGAVLLAGGAE
jgi:cobalt-zinc-cadmium efflux system membrane fusion protein